MRCAVTLCEDEATIEVTFVTKDVYVYCHEHGWRYTQYWVNRGHDFTMVENWRSIRSGRQLLAP